MALISSELSENLASVRERIRAAASRAGRGAEEIILIAVSKTHSARKIQMLHEAGVRHFGENRVQERESKQAQLAGLEAVWHMIGHLQKNKAARAASLFDSVDSLDSIVLASRLDRGREELIATFGELDPHVLPGGRKPLRVLIEVKLDPEPAKSGVQFDEVPKLIEALRPMSNLELCGLMGVPPYFDDPEDARPYFRMLRESRDIARAQFGPNILPVLSMGMSHDFETAIEEGATEIRVGTALFGRRDLP